MRRSARRGPTGRMRGSVVADAVDPLEWEVGDTDWAAHIEEFGSVKQAPHPFVFPAGDRAERRVGSIIQHVGRG